MNDILTISYIIGEELVKTGDESIDPEKEYLLYSYVPVEASDSDDPTANKWYEFDGTAYFPTVDEEVDPEKEYYEYTLTSYDPEEDDVVDMSELYEVLEGTTVNQLSGYFDYATAPQSSTEDLVETDESEDAIEELPLDE